MLGQLGFIYFMTDKHYYDTLTKLQEMGVMHDYFVGWAGGYLENPDREEQRITPAYSAGYEDGKNRHTGQASKFCE